MSSPELDERQRAYLLALRRFDKQAEQTEHTRWAAGAGSRRADEWRWIEYGPNDNTRGTLRMSLRKSGLDDTNAGAIWDTLRAIGFVEVRRVLHIEIIQVRLTRRGRAYARKLGEEGHTPRGELSTAAWRVLALAYRARPQWVCLTDMSAPHAAEQVTLALLRRGFIRGDWDDFGITAAGVEFYRRSWAEYRVLYPRVDAPEPDATLP